MRQVTHLRQQPVVDRGIHLFHPHPDALPQRTHAGQGVAVDRGGRRQHAQAAVEQGLECGSGPGVLGAGNRVRGYAVDRRGQQRIKRVDDRLFDAAGVGHDAACRQMGQKAAYHRPGRLDRHREQHQIGSARRPGRVERVAVDQPPLQRNFEIGLGPPEPDHLADETAGLGRQTERAADQADSGDEHTFEEDWHENRSSFFGELQTRRSRDRFDTLQPFGMVRPFDLSTGSRPRKLRDRPQQAGAMGVSVGSACPSFPGNFPLKAPLRRDGAVTPAGAHPP